MSVKCSAQSLAHINFSIDSDDADGRDDYPYVTKTLNGGVFVTRSNLHKVKTQIIKSGFT